MYDTILVLVLDLVLDVVLKVVPLDAGMNALLLDVFSNAAIILVDCCIFLDAVPVVVVGYLKQWRNNQQERRRRCQ
jgi:hypothetical protein